MSNQFRTMTPNHKGWHRMWDALASRFGDRSCYNRDNGESWQYKGTINDTHQFLHRDLPRDAQIMANMPAGKAIAYVTAQPDDFELSDRFVQELTIPDIAPPNNYACTRCGNKKLNTSNDRSCWKCGEKVVT